MNRADFDKYSSYRPKIFEHILYWIIITIWLLSTIFIFIFSYKQFPALQNYLYNKNNGIVFSMDTTAILFSLPIFFISLFLNFMILVKIFSLIPDMKNTILFYDIAATKTNDYIIYKGKNKINTVFVAIVLTIAMFFAIALLFVHLRIDNSGIYYNKIFEVREKYYTWNQLKSVSVYPEIEYNRKNKNLVTKMILEFGDNKIDIWKGNSGGHTRLEILIKIINMIDKYSDINITFDNNFTEEILDLLNNKSSQEKRDDILNLFNYLNSRQYFLEN